jgi:pimeloyl-ACP methyl ester carboxylesterase
MPFLFIAGGSDELSPIDNTMRLFRALPAAKQLVVYKESRHSEVDPVWRTDWQPN